MQVLKSQSYRFIEVQDFLRIQSREDFFKRTTPRLVIDFPLIRAMDKDVFHISLYQKYVLIHLDKLVSNLGYYSLFKQLQGSVKKEISKIYIRQEYLSRKSFSFGKDALNKLQFSNAKHNYLLLKQLPKTFASETLNACFPIEPLRACGWR